MTEGDPDGELTAGRPALTGAGRGRRDQLARRGRPFVGAPLGGHGSGAGARPDRPGHGQPFVPGAGEQGPQYRAGGRPGDRPLDDGEEVPLGRCGVGEQSPYAVEVGVGLAPDERAGEALLAAELVVEGLAGDPGVDREVGHPYGGPGPVHERGERGVEQGLAGVRHRHLLEGTVLRSGSTGDHALSRCFEGLEGTSGGFGGLRWTVLRAGITRG
ncbi:hypothetical protein BN2537_6095 [Streptomyces venezuelae]|nr:hypothetical protein BN2537_6095 [Streptomyces venezuelae]